MPTKDFEDFYFSCFDKSHGAIHNGLDTKALFNLQGEELQEAERLLLEAIQEENMDSRSVQAVGYLKLRAASPILKDRLSNSIDKEHRYNQVHSAWALYRIEKYPESVQIIVDVLNNTPKDNRYQWSRMMAVEALGEFGKDLLAVNTLLETLFDEDDFIGSLATKSIKKIFQSNEELVFQFNEITHAQIEFKHPNPMREKKVYEILLKIIDIIRLEMPEGNAVHLTPRRTDPPVAEGKRRDFWRLFRSK